MRIERIECQNYKSLRNASLEGCESLNILIGKNNAGKSNILKAIDAFHQYINPSPFVTILTNDEAKRDTFEMDGNPSESALIAATMQMTAQEKSQLIEEIAHEAPQVKNALAALDPEMRIRVEVIISRTENMAHIRAIDLIDIKTATKKTC